MVSISRLYLDKIEESEGLRYTSAFPEWKGIPAPRPVVVWNMTQRCNLQCAHCYAECTTEPARHELTTSEAKLMIDDLAEFKVPYLLFSGGEPLMREDLCELVAYAKDKGVRGGLSTNATLITAAKAAELKYAGLTYAGVSIDGLEANHDRMRGAKGSFAQALEGVKNCNAAGIRTGFRFTITKDNVSDALAIFDLAREHGVDRICFYHLVYSGRGSAIRDLDLEHSKKRTLLDSIIDRCAGINSAGHRLELLTVDNHCDGIYLYKRMKNEGNKNAPAVLDLLTRQGASGTGIKISCIGWDGTVYPDQFWRNQKLGSIQTRPFSEIWSDPENELLTKLRNKEKFIEGRCASCSYLDICGGNFRARAEAVYGNIWAQEPACYLTDKEIHTRP